MASVRLKVGSDRGGDYVLAREITRGEQTRVEPAGVRSGSRYTPGETWHGYTYADLAAAAGGQLNIVVQLDLPKP